MERKADLPVIARPQPLLQEILSPAPAPMLSGKAFQGGRLPSHKSLSLFSPLVAGQGHEDWHLRVTGGGNNQIN